MNGVMVIYPVTDRATWDRIFATWSGCSFIMGKIGL